MKWDLKQKIGWRKSAQIAERIRAIELKWYSEIDQEYLLAKPVIPKLYSWCRSNETCKYDCRKETSKFLKSFKAGD